MEVSTITTYFLFTVAAHYSNDKIRSEIRSCTNYFATLGEQYSKQSMEIITITTYYLFTLAVHSSKYETRSEKISLTPSCDTQCNQ